jgi:hypothetical protein
MDWCEDNGLDYVFGLSGNKILAAAVEDKADDIRTRRALEAPQRPSIQLQRVRKCGSTQRKTRDVELRPQLCREENQKCASVG